eukprot:1156204-Pelagomonas_calceolata.AAC.8
MHPNHALQVATHGSTAARGFMKERACASQQFVHMKALLGTHAMKVWQPSVSTHTTLASWQKRTMIQKDDGCALVTPQPCTCKGATTRACPTNLHFLHISSPCNCLPCPHTYASMPGRISPCITTSRALAVKKHIITQ